MKDLLEHQAELLRHEVQNDTSNPVFVIVYDTQGVEGVITTLTGKSAESEQIQDGIARFRLSNYLPDGEMLVERIQEAAETCDWIFLYTGCSYCPEVVFELFQTISQQEFEKPRIFVVAEDTDWRSGNEHMQQLFRLGKFVNLTLNKRRRMDDTVEILLKNLQDPEG